MQQIIRELTTRVEALEKALAAETELRTRERHLYEYRHSKWRAKIIRLGSGASGTMFHVGGAYERGSRVKIPRTPEKLKYARHGPLRIFDEHADRENMRYGRFHGLPDTV